MSGLRRLRQGGAEGGIVQGQEVDVNVVADVGRRAHARHLVPPPALHGIGDEARLFEGAEGVGDDELAVADPRIAAGLLEGRGGQCLREAVGAEGPPRRFADPFIRFEDAAGRDQSAAAARLEGFEHGHEITGVGGEGRLDVEIGRAVVLDRRRVVRKKVEALRREREEALVAEQDLEFAVGDGSERLEPSGPQVFVGLCRPAHDGGHPMAGGLERPGEPEAREGSAASQQNSHGAGSPRCCAGSKSGCPRSRSETTLGLCGQSMAKAGSSQRTPRSD